MVDATLPATGERPMVTAFDADQAREIEVTGGKGANLARLVAAGFTVPPGFCVTTAAYWALVDDPAIRGAVRRLNEFDPGDHAAISDASAEVRERIEARPFPESVRRRVEEAAAELDETSFAVRSSATAEDLPTASFAGQHETFLAVPPAALLESIRSCMASLFTERAVTYRLRNGVPQDRAALAVVVQTMADADVAGVLFTADPITGNRRVASVDANYGLGESIVAGEVSGDNARVDRRTGEILSYEVGEKALSVRSREDAAGGIERADVSTERRAAHALSDRQLRTLVELGDRVESTFGTPQDVEWALVGCEVSSDASVRAVEPHGGEFVLLQSRPITSLFPLPSPFPRDDSLHVYLSFGHQQAMPEALPPLVVDFWHDFMNGAAARLLPPDAEPRVATEAGNRLYLDLTPLVRIGPVRRAVRRALGALSEPAAGGFDDLLRRRRADLHLRGRIDGLRTLARTIRRAGPLLRTALPGAGIRFARTFLLGPPDPATDRAWFDRFGRSLGDRIREGDSPTERVERAFGEFDILFVLSRVLPRMTSFLAAIVAGKLLSRWFPDAADDIDALGKGFEFEIVTRMNQRLGDLADVAREHPAVVDALADEASLSEIEAVAGGPEFVAAFESFLDEFGHRATGEIDLRRPRWRENPSPLLRTVASNVAHGEIGSHREHFDSLRRNATAAGARLESRVGGGSLGPLRRAVVRRLIRAYRGGLQIREYPKQALSHLFAAVHDVLAEAGASLASDGKLDDADDVWFLRREELLAALDGEYVAVDIAARRREYERYAAMTPPPLLTSEGEQPTASSRGDLPDGTLSGTPVSAGVIEGRARVIRDPSGATLETGEILIAPSTDPGWTPLFLNAAGLVMEVGGRMTHGALVAREYGIPAVASVPNATTEITTGDRVRVDGKRGTVELL